MNEATTPLAVRWEHERLQLLDQRKLPHETHYLDVRSAEDAWTAINSLAVRGAPAIGIAAAYALVVVMAEHRHRPREEFLSRLQEAGEYLNSARPTAVNLSWSIRRLVDRARITPSYSAIRQEAETIHAEDRAICRRIGEHGQDLIAPGANVLTACADRSRRGFATPAAWFIRCRMSLPVNAVCCRSVRRSTVIRGSRATSRYFAWPWRPSPWRASRT